MPDPIEALLDQLTASGAIPQGADADTVRKAALAGLDSAGYRVDHPWTQGVAEKLAAARMRQTTAAGRIDPSLIPAMQQDFGGQSAAEVERRAQGFRADPGAAQALGEATAKGEASPYWSSMRHAVMGPLTAAAAAVIPSESVARVAAEERMLSEAHQRGVAAAGGETASELGHLTAGLAPMAFGPVPGLIAMGVQSGGQVAGQVQDLGGGQAAQLGGMAVGGTLGAALPMGAAAVVTKAGGALAKSAVGAGIKTAAEAVGFTPTAATVGGRVVITATGQALGAPAMAAGTAAGLGVAGQGEAAMQTLEQAGDLKAMGVQAALGVLGHTVGNRRMAGSIADPRAQGSILDRAAVPYLQPEIHERAVLRRKQAADHEAARLALEAELQRGSDRALVKDLAPPEEDWNAYGYNQQIEQADAARELATPLPAADSPIRQFMDEDAAHSRNEAAARRELEAEAAAREPEPEMRTEWTAQQEREAARARFAAARKAADDEQAAVDLRMEQEAKRRRWEEEQARLDAADQAQRDAVAAEALRIEAENKRLAGADAANKLAAEQRLAALEREAEALRADRYGASRSEEAAALRAEEAALRKERQRRGALGLPLDGIDAKLNRLAEITPEAEAHDAKVQAVEGEAAAIRRRLAAAPALKQVPQVPAARQRPAMPPELAEQVPDYRAPMQAEAPAAAGPQQPVQDVLGRTDPSMVPERFGGKPEVAERQVSEAPVAESQPAAPAEQPTPGEVPQTGRPSARALRWGADNINPRLAVDPTHGEAPAAKAIEGAENKRVLVPEATEEGRKATAWVRRLPGKLFGAFQGNKAKATANVASVIRRSMSEARRAQVTKTTDANGGSGSYGLSQTLTNMPNAREHDILEWNEARRNKIEMAQTEDPDAVMREMENRGIWRDIKAVIDAGNSGGKVTGRLDSLLPEDFGADFLGPDGKFRADLTPEQRREITLLQTVLDVLPRKGINKGKVEASKVYEHLRGGVHGYLRGAKALGDEARRRGVKVNYLQGDAHTHQFEAGSHHFVYLDPPYYDTAGYSKSDSNPKGLVPAEVYAKMPQLIEKLRRQGNAGVYTDEAWWGRPRQLTDGSHRLADETLEKIYNASDTFDTHQVGNRHESIATFDGTRERPAPITVERSAVQRSEAPDAGGYRSGGEGGDRPGQPGSRPDAGEAGQPAVPRPVAGRITPEEAGRIREAAKVALGPDVRSEVQADGSVKLTSKAGTFTVTPLDKNLPPEQVSPAGWLASVRANGLMAQAQATLDSIGVRVSHKQLMAVSLENPLVKRLAALPPEKWAKVVDDIPVRGSSVTVAPGVDGGRILGIHRDLLAADAPNVLRKVLTEEATEHIWKALVKTDPDLAAEIIARADPTNKAVHLNTRGELRDGLNPETVEPAGRAIAKALTRIALQGGLKDSAPVPTSVWGKVVAWLKRITSFLREVNATPADVVAEAHLRGEGPLAQERTREPGRDTYSVGRPRMDEGEREANFRHWFGDSKLQDAEGKPFVLYHGTTKSGFKEFKTGLGKFGEGVYLTGRKWMAENYAMMGEGRRRSLDDDPQPGAGTYPLYARIENPFYANSDEVGISAERKLGWNGDEPLGEFIKSKGYDGIITTDNGKPPRTAEDVREALVFDTKQIKSATGNNGEFDPQDARVTYSVGKPEVPAGTPDTELELSARRKRAEADPDQHFLPRDDAHALAQRLRDDDTYFDRAMGQLDAMGESGGHDIVAAVDVAREEYARLLDKANRTHDAQAIIEAQGWERMIQRAVSASARILRYSQPDMRKPEDVRYFVQQKLSTSDSPKWQRLMREAGSNRDAQARVAAAFLRERSRIVKKIKEATGIDIDARDLGESLAGDTYSVNVLSDMIEREKMADMTWKDMVADLRERATVGQVVAEVVRGNILTVASPVPQIGQAGYFLVKSSARRVADALLAKVVNDPALSSGGKEGVRDAIMGVGTDLIEGLTLAIKSQRAGESLVYKRLLHMSGDGGETSTSEGGKALLPWYARAATGPGAVLTGLVDDMTWVAAFRMSQRFHAKRLGLSAEDPKVLNLARDAADEATFRGQFKGFVEKSVGALGAMRAPVKKDAAGNTVTNWGGLLGYGFMPIFKSMVKGLQEGVNVAAVPVSLARFVREAHTLKSERGAKAITVEAGRQHLTEQEVRELHYRAAVEAGGRLIMGTVLMGIGAAYATASSGATDPDERRVRMTDEPPGHLAGVPASRFSPAYEPTQIAAILRDADKRGFNDSAGAAYDVLLNRPLLGSLPSFDPSRQPKDPTTGEPMGLAEQTMQTWQDHLSVGKFWSDAARRLTETTAKRQSGGAMDRNYGLDREDRHSPFGEARPNGGFFRKLIFGTEATPTAAESALARRLVQLNEKVVEGVKDKAVARDLQWWSAGSIPTTQPVAGASYRYSPAEQDQMRKVAGEAFMQMASNIPDDAPPRAQLNAMRQAWSYATKMAEASVAPSFMRRVMSERAGTAAP